MKKHKKELNTKEITLLLVSEEINIPTEQNIIDKKNRAI
ncbi:hypothetical protein JBKA6_1437 [Ichthyobacterium seriolicida]|uniref:Uncharacterized protein n=1 Tax=Ichthyobacterium seriolicida TaxID=242600 RepID=A0A1J1DZU4_9FLAO|nr:hypothetical protein JBKA6_1437 [Ichthyobacterium seriolicida]